MSKIIPTLKEIKDWSYRENALSQDPLRLTNYALYGCKKLSLGIDRVDKILVEYDSKYSIVGQQGNFRRKVYMILLQLL